MRDYASDPPIEERVGDRLRERGESLATTESCTGGLIGSLVTDVPGSSEYFDRTLVTYTYDAKLDTGVTREALDEHGAVSAPVARQMAQAVRDQADTTWGLSTTGVAGPTGGTDAKPVGTVYIGLAHRGEWGAAETWTDVSRYEFDGDRLAVKEQIARKALETLHETL